MERTNEKRKGKRKELKGTKDRKWGARKYMEGKERQ